MYALHASKARQRPATLARVAVLFLPVLAAAAGSVWLTAALAGRDGRFTGEAPVVGTIVAIVVGYFAYRLIRLAWRRHTIPGSGPCRSVGWFGVGLAAIALTGLMIPVAFVAGASGCEVSDGVAIGLTLASVAFLPSLLLMPGAATSVVARVRRALDGVSVGICLLFTAWILVIAPNGRIASVGFWVAMLACCMISTTVVMALRPSVGRRASALCAGGVGAGVLGLVGLYYSLCNGARVGWPSVFGLLLIGSMVLIWRGASLEPAGDETPVLDPSTLAAYPLLAVPAAIAIVVGLHRLLTGGDFDRASVLLGVLSVVAVVLRETFAARDVSRYARRIAEQEAQFRTLVAGSADVIMILDSDLLVRWQSVAAARQFGLSDQEVVGRHFQSMVHPDDAVLVSQRLADVRAGFGGGPDGDAPVLVEARLRDGFGRWRETESAITDQRTAPEVSGLVVHIRDIGERRELERTLHRLAYADQLTGLANRRQVLMSIVALRSSPRTSGALLLIELDGFNSVNDVRGFDVGDAVLVKVAHRLRAGVGPGDIPARLSGDEFAVVTEGTAVQSYALATRLLTMLAEPIQLPGVTVYLTASVGMTDLASAANGDDVLRQADLALRRAKQLGRGKVEWYDANVEKEIGRRMTLEQELPEAMQRGELDLMYQPILDLVRGRPTAVEALLRWRHPRLGTVRPADIIPVAEDLSLINEIGAWVLDEATRQLTAWLREGRNISMAVNVSPCQMDGTAFTAEVADVLARYEIPADRLVLELAETGIGNCGEGLEDRVGALRSLGVRTALDEFGTGVASLTHLRNLPMDMVKIGQTFFDDGRADPPVVGQSVPLIDVMVGLGRRLGIEVVAQGLEAPGHLDVVRAAGCRLGQGHLFARPQPAERTEAYLDGFPARA